MQNYRDLQQIARSLGRADKAIKMKHIHDMTITEQLNRRLSV